MAPLELYGLCHPGTLRDVRWSHGPGKNRTLRFWRSRPPGRVPGNSGQPIQPPGTQSPLRRGARCRGRIIGRTASCVLSRKAACALTIHWRGGRVDEGGRFEIYCGFTPTVGSNPTLSALGRRAGSSVNRRDDRVDEGARLESECAATYRGFESHSLRHTFASNGVMAGSSRLKTMNPARPGREQR